MENEIFDYLYKHLKTERYEHTLQVYELASKLAANYNEDVYNIQIAALLHDCGKWMTADESKNYISVNKVKIKYYPFILKYAPQILHAYISEDIAKKKFGVKNTEILNAVKYHTVGRINMSNAEKIIFIADALSPDRKLKFNMEHDILYGDLNRTFKFVMQNKIQYVVSKYKVLHPDIVSIWNYYNK
ncbi:MAG: bis(5'-nucleosyl)-tetraphosphatase (symmetrical) YqeK [Endomicrobiaceae bacterium]|jgi:predicted HD superfamily hydrolase involved in NAD metabolism|nr:bis(5'-nucleosyl)-tetraphosphatase (symmetrical) YqeK [Endomicrobiaceae bacterium]MDD3729762.1 bis(5'-nucleosyl)-tetraphosphatase (symmetrical) YqeK [Endomicrobiaceae bacterium]MDD4165995.1 bis(5'-nucleosyl)-tetraphosphatase (symmetrical) YqeK [Endomicrobiaceae bacterium]